MKRASAQLALLIDYKVSIREFARANQIERHCFAFPLDACAVERKKEVPSDPLLDEEKRGWAELPSQQRE